MNCAMGLSDLGCKAEDMMANLSILVIVKDLSILVIVKDLSILVIAADLSKCGTHFWVIDDVAQGVTEVMSCLAHGHLREYIAVVVA